MEKTIGQQIKAMANKAGVKTTVKTVQRSVYVLFRSEPSESLATAIKALETHEAHGDLMDDTRYYTGISIHFWFKYPIPAATVAQFEAIKATYQVYGYQFQQEIRGTMGIRGQACLDMMSF